MGLLQGMLLCSNNVLLLLITLARPRLPGEVDVHELQSSLEKRALNSGNGGPTR